MNRKNFTPRLFVDIGETAAFYTLRETYLHERHVPGDGPMGNAVVNGVYQGTVETEVRSFHHQNLAQDADEAWAKAKQLAEALGLELEGDREDLSLKMRDIQRADAEEKARRIREQEEREARWAAEREERAAQRLQKLACGIFPFGPYRDQVFAAAPRGYLTWLARNVGKFTDNPLLKAAAEAVLECVPHLLFPEPNPDAHWLQEGKRGQVRVTVTRVTYYSRPKFGASWLNETVWINTMVTQAGECLVVMSPSFKATEGDDLTIRATVKEHGHYGAQAQTKLSRVNILIDHNDSEVSQ